MKTLLSITSKETPHSLFAKNKLPENIDLALSDIERLSEIQSLFKYNVPDANINLFALMPRYWLWNDLIKNGLVDVVEQLNPQHRLIFNAVMWDQARFYRYVRTPSSIKHHHAIVNGNLEHTLEVCKNISKLAKDNSRINLSFLLLLALLHDAGKAEEYREHRFGDMTMSERGKLLGHRLTSYEWLVEAYTKWNIPKDDEYVKLLHLLTAVKNIPHYLGYRTPKFEEFYLLSCCDSLSASLNYLRTEQKNESALLSGCV